MASKKDGLRDRWPEGRRERCQDGQRQRCPMSEQVSESVFERVSEQVVKPRPGGGGAFRRRVPSVQHELQHQPSAT
eukprot:360770-Chlamydomonas_euryale.AAC.5